MLTLKNGQNEYISVVERASIYEREVPVDVNIPYIDVDLPLVFKDTSDELNEILDQIKLKY